MEIPFDNQAFNGHYAYVKIAIENSPVIVDNLLKEVILHQLPFQEPIDGRYLPYIRPVVQAYVRGYAARKIWPENA